MADLKELTEALLSTTTVALNAVAQTTLYTVPVGKRLVITKALLIAGASAGDGVLTIGEQGSATDFLAAQTLSNLAAQYDMVILQPVPNATPVLSKSYPAGSIIEADVTTGSSGGATNSMMLFGILY
jgi:hypothetical protein